MSCCYDKGAIRCVCPLFHDPPGSRLLLFFWLSFPSEWRSICATVSPSNIRNTAGPCVGRV